MLRQIVVNDQHVAALLHEVLRNAGRRVRRDVRETGRIVTLSDDHDGVIQRALFTQGGDRLGHSGGALPDGAIDAQHVLPALVENGVERNGCFACRPVPQNQLALTAPDRNERVNDLDAGLQGYGDGCAIHDMRRGAFDGQTCAGNHRAIVVQRPPQWIDDASDQPLTHRDVHHMPSAFHLIAGMQLPVVAEQDGADFVFVDVEGDAIHVSGKSQYFIEPHPRQTGHLRDAGGDAGDGANLAQHELRRGVFPCLA